MKVLLLTIIICFVCIGETVRLSNGGVEYEMDNLGRYFVFLDLDHHKLHEGRLFTVTFNDLDLDAGDTMEICFATKDTTRWTHLEFLIEGTAQAEVVFFEDVTITDSDTGIVKSAKNRNRNSSNTPLTRCFRDPDIDSYGTPLDTLEFGAGKFVGGEIRGANEWILKQNSLSLIRIESLGQDNIVRSKITFYELLNR